MQFAILSLCLGFLAVAPASLSALSGHDATRSGFPAANQIFQHGDGGGPAIENRCINSFC